MNKIISKFSIIGSTFIIVFFYNACGESSLDYSLLGSTQSSSQCLNKNINPYATVSNELAQNLVASYEFENNLFEDLSGRILPTGGNPQVTLGRDQNRFY